MPKKEFANVIEVFKKRIDDAVKGPNPAQDIQNAVWEMLKEFQQVGNYDWPKST